MARVLVVDDEQAIRESMDLILGDHGHEVRTASDGREALAQLRGWSPEIIVTDWMMPHMGGEQLLGRLRSVPGCRGTPVIVMSALSLTARPSVTAFLRKPFSAGLLLELIARHTGAPARRMHAGTGVAAR
jgi:CheY-like chemotaxis protein